MIYIYCGTDGAHLWGLPADPAVALSEADLAAAGYTPAAVVASGLYAASDPEAPAPARKAAKAAAPVPAPKRGKAAPRITTPWDGHDLVSAPDPPGVLSSTPIPAPSPVDPAPADPPAVVEEPPHVG